MLRGQAGRQWMGTWDLRFNHQKDKDTLKDSADMGCCICASIYKSRHVLQNEPIDFEGDRGVRERSFRNLHNRLSMCYTPNCQESSRVFLMD
jgi:hypothetical protein